MAIWMRGNRYDVGAGRAMAAIAAISGLCLAGVPAAAQTYGLATMQPGTLAHTTGTAIAKVLKDKGALNTLVQTTAGETVLIPMVARGEIDLGIANLAEVQAQVEGSGPNRQADLRLIGVIHPLWASFFVRKDAAMKANADLNGKRVGLGYSAMRTVDLGTVAIQAGTLTILPIRLWRDPSPSAIAPAAPVVAEADSVCRMVFCQ